MRGAAQRKKNPRRRIEFFMVAKNLISKLGLTPEQLDQQVSEIIHRKRQPIPQGIA